MDLVPYIFHEHQEQGSQLCAQHCLNNLLQQHIYSEMDLADVARKLDQAEAANEYAAPPTKSYNYDDTGYFSISVLEKAMQMWDLTLVRWRGEAMRPFVNSPEEQAGFILNLANHWFALRRFGSSTRWYNLNSFLPSPEWISSTYLQMVLTQAEAEGYSVFVVRKAGAGAGESAGPDPGEAAGWGDGGVGVLPEAGADLMAAHLGEVVNRRGSGGSLPPPMYAGPSNGNGAGPSGSHSVFEEEEAEASTSTSYAAGSGRRRRRQEDLTSALLDEDDLLNAPSSRARTPRARRNGHHADADVFDNDAAMLNELDHDGLDVDLDHDDEEVEEEEEDYTTAYHAGTAGSRASGAYGGPTDFAFQSRSYDDEDEALQAALKASMEGLPEGYVMPELKPIVASSVLHSPPLSVAPEPEPAPVQAPKPAETAITQASKDEEEFDDDDDDEPAKELSPEEVRAARLARFQ